MGLFRRHADAVLTELTWRRVVELREIEWVAERSGTRPTVEVRNLRVHREQYLERDPVADQNGIPESRMASRDVYEFEVARWLPGRTIEATGSGQSGVHWPEYKLGPDEEVSGKTETYTAVFKVVDSGKKRKAKLDEATWRSLQNGASYRLELGIFGHVHSVLPATR